MRSIPAALHPIALAAALLCAPGCDPADEPDPGDDDTTAADDDDTPPPCDDPGDLGLDPQAFHAFYPGEIGPAHPRPVLPSDRYLVPEDGGRLRAEWPDVLMAGSLDHTDGFPTFLPILIPFSAPVDPDSLDAESIRLFLVGDSWTDDRNEPWLGARIVHREDEDLVYLVPDAALPEGATIGVALVDSIRSIDGEPLRPSAHYRCLVEGWDDPDYALLADGVAAGLATLADAGVDVDSVVQLNTFHTGAPHARLLDARAELDAHVAAGALDGAFVHVLDATGDDDRLTAEVKALLPPDYQPGGSYPALRTFVQGSVAIPDVRPALQGPLGGDPEPPEEVPFTLLIPELPDAETMPVIVYMHGIACCREHVLSPSAPFLEAGYLLAAIDARAHYVRADPPIEECGDPSATLAFIDITDFQGTGERFALTGLDELAFQRFLQAELDTLLAELADEQGLTQAPAAGPFHLVGHSLGGMVGTVAASALDDADLDAGQRFVASASGGGLLAIAMPLLEPGLLGEPMPEDMLLLFLEGATSMTLADPLSHAPFVRADMLIQEGEADETMPNATSEMLALTAGLPLLEPLVWSVEPLATAATPAAGNLDGGRTGGLFQFSPASHNLFYSGVAGDPQLGERARWQVETFLATGTIVDAYLYGEAR